MRLTVIAAAGAVLILFAIVVHGEVSAIMPLPLLTPAFRETGGN